MLPKPYKIFYQRISRKIEKRRIFTDPLHTLAYGTDASLYRLIPKIVIKAISEEELAAILTSTRDLSLPVTVRAAGTSLSGQASSDSILVALNWGFKGYRILGGASKISLEPGVIGEFANNLLKPYHKKIGPDPASIASAMIGGIINNNSSGMCCGVEENSYKTIDTLRIMLADGTVLDTSDPDSVVAFRVSHARLLDDLLVLSEEVKSDSILREKIIQKYKIKNTTGYSLNALVDFSDPIDILTHLIVGSEGTLSVLLGVTLRTVDEHPLKASAMIYYPDIYTACKAVEILKTELKGYVFAVELFDRISIRTVEDRPIAPPVMKTLGPDCCALLVETRSFEEESLDDNIIQIAEKIKSIPTLEPIAFTSDPKVYSHYWTLRKGLIPSIGAIRKNGTTVIIEDVAFPIEHLADATVEIQALFKKYHYEEGIVMGHALEGNLHLVFAQEFSTPSEVTRYRGFMDDLCRLTAEKYNGSLKAEHGTGRNVAPYVEMEWGAKAYGIMKRIKELFDPDNLLNPGVLLNADPDLHVKNLKEIPETDPLVDKCIECGFCESSCPSRSHTLTPRQRIVVSRELSRIERIGKTGEEWKNYRVIKKLFSYEGDESCAGCSMCEPVCPVSINTGKLIKQIRSREKTPVQLWLADLASRRFRGLTAMMSSVLNLGAVLRKVGIRPGWLERLPHPVTFQKSKAAQPSSKKVIYFPSCVSRNLRGSEPSLPLSDLIPRLLAKAGYEVIYPAGDIGQLCCGMPFSSKGYNASAEHKWKEVKEALHQAGGDKYPILIDMSPCTAFIKEGIEKLRDSQNQNDRVNWVDWEVLEPVAFTKKYLLGQIPLRRLDKRVAIHATCSATRMGLGDDLIELTKALTSEVIVPQEIKCCGFAGDKGFKYPRLNADALAGLPDQIEGCCEGYSTSITCEIGLTRHGGIPYKSIFYLVAEAAGMETQE